METIFSNVTFSENTEFSDSAAEDSNYAKLFWKSINSPSIMESKLNPKDANQLLKLATTSESKKGKEALAFPSAEELKNTALYIEKVHRLEENDRKQLMEQRVQKIEQLRKNSKAKVSSDVKKSEQMATDQGKKASAQSMHEMSIAEPAEMANSYTGAQRLEPIRKEQNTEVMTGRKASPRLLAAEDKLEYECGFNDIDDVRNLP